VLLLTVHHIVADGWSIDIFVRELLVLYTAYRQGMPARLAELPVQYADFAVWQRQWLAAEMMAEHLAYWREQLAGAPPLLELPTDRPRPPIQTFQGAHIGVALPSRLSEQVQRFSRETGSTLFMTLLAAFKVLLMRYSGQEDVVVGVPVANRTRVEIEPLIGFFVNTLVLRSNLAGNPPFRTLLQQVQERTLEAYEHQEVPFEKVVEDLQPQRNLSYSPLFQVMFVLQNVPKSAMELPELALEPLETASPVAKFDLTLAVQEEAGGLRCEWEYNTDLFDAATVERMAGHFQRVVEGMVANPAQPIHQLPLLTEAEREQILREWNDTTTAYPQDTCLHQLFEEQVARTPEAIAVVFDDTMTGGQSDTVSTGTGAGSPAPAGPVSLTYGALNARANQLAHYLQSVGVGPETLVGLCLDRSLEMIVGLLGVLKAGGAYVPFDPTSPQERLAFMLADAQVPVLLTHAHLAPQLPAPQAQVICLDTDWPTIAQHSVDNPMVGMTSTHLAYVIYTSGSTGQPKGVLIDQDALVAHCCVIQKTLHLQPSDRVLQFANPTFDVLVEEVFPTLAAGAAVGAAA
jgi:non-ribosomal peptide synthetase component F